MQKAQKNLRLTNDDCDGFNFAAASIAICAVAVFIFFLFGGQIAHLLTGH